jgi:SAM-dependent methyltransferase
MDRFEVRVAAFAEKFLGDLGAALHAATVVIGDRLGLYRTLANMGNATASELAAVTGYDERYLLEWLNAQAASGYCEYASGRYWLDNVQAYCLADEAAPAFLTAGMLMASAVHHDIEATVDAFSTGAGVPWGAHHPHLYAGVERFFRPGYRNNLTTAWIPALEGVVDKLRAGARVADVGCGHGASTILVAKAFPASGLFGFDPHPASVEAARKSAAESGAGHNVSFEVASAQDFSGTSYDLICVLDAFHDMGDPVGAAAHIRAALADDGTWLLVEPAAGDTVKDNLAGLGRLFYSASTLLCTPTAKSQPGGYALGAQATTEQLRDICLQAGFTGFRLVEQTPVNRVFEVTP